MSIKRTLLRCRRRFQHISIIGIIGVILFTHYIITSTKLLNIGNIQFEPNILVIESVPLPDVTPLLTLCTTIKDNQMRTHIHNRTLHNWSSLDSHIQPVLLVDNTTNLWTNWSQLAQELGWKVWHLDKTDVSNGVPMIRQIFLKLQERVTSQYIGYANADVLFDRSLVMTLSYLVNRNVSSNPERSTLAIGRRRNVNLTEYDFGDGSDLKRLNSISFKVKLYKSQAVDYFIMSREGFPWVEVPDFVVGRIGYDNWLVAFALENNHTVLDATGTINCLHQTGSDGIKSGFNNNPEDRFTNIDIMKDNNRYRCMLDKGRSICAPIIVHCAKQKLKPGHNVTQCIMGEHPRRKRPIYCTDCLPRSLILGDR